MSATKFAVKRKINDEPAVELDIAPKVRKVEERKNSSEKQLAKEVDSSVVFHSKKHNTSGKGRQKLSSILHYEKRYKYYCKKHNVIYLIEKSRNKSKEHSKQSRDNLVNSFRSLNLTKNVSAKSHLGNSQHSQKLLSNMEDGFNDDGGDQKSVAETEKCRVSRIFVISDESDKYLAQTKKDTEDVDTSNKQSAHKLNWIHPFIYSDDSEEDNDSDEGYEEDYHLKEETSKDEDFIVMRSPGKTSIIMKKIERSSSCLNDDDKCCTFWNCLNNNYFYDNTLDFDSFFDENKN